MTEQFLYGVHAVSAALSNPERVVHKLFIACGRTNSKIQALCTQAESAQIGCDYLSMQQMNQRFADKTHQGVVALVSALLDYKEADLPALLASLKKPALILVLDGITDPHNLGACLRTADAAGVDFVIIPKDKAVGLTSVVSKVACGAAETVPMIRVTNLVRTLERLKTQGIWIYGAAGEATQTLYQMDCSASLAVVMGAEGKGLRRLTKAHCDALFALPMLGSVSSLNVSVAAGISLYEVLRQRIKNE